MDMNDMRQQLTQEIFKDYTSENEEDVTKENSDRIENNTSKATGGKEAKPKKQTKNALSITRALITFGYESWIAFEPGKYEP